MGNAQKPSVCDKYPARKPPLAGFEPPTSWLVHAYNLNLNA